MQTTYNGTGPVGANEIWSAFHLSFTVNEGNANGCASDMLTTYGQGTIASMGPPAAASSK